MSINKPNVGDLFYEAFMEALAEEAAPPKKVNLRVLHTIHLTNQITDFITVVLIIVPLKTNHLKREYPVFLGYSLFFYFHKKEDIYQCS